MNAMVRVMEVTQLPVITERLEQVKNAVIQQVNSATSLLCTEDTVKEVKKSRAELSSQFKAWEEQRKAIKQAVMQPYECFEAVYKECITNTYRSADAALKSKIDTVEDELKEKKTAEIKSYFEECLAHYGIDFVTWEQTGIHVTLSASRKSLKEKAKTFAEQTANDLAMIVLQEHSAEILVEYKRTLNAVQAITTIQEREQAIAAERERQLAAAKQKQQAVAAPPMQPIQPPVEVENPPLYKLRFTVTGTKEQLRRLKAFMDAGGYQYE